MGLWHPLDTALMKRNIIVLIVLAVAVYFYGSFFF